MVITALVAIAATLLAVELVSHLLALGRVYDEPNARSSHQQRTLRGGGFGALLGTLVAVAVSISELEMVPWAGAMATIAAFSIVGLIDDIRSISAKLRLVAQVAIGLSVFAWIPAFNHDVFPELLLGAGAVFLVVAFVNAFNFMDGLNGISAVNAMVAGAGFALMGTLEDLTWLQYFGAITAGAGMGFLPHNFPTARIFLGDAGSYFFGAALSIVSVLAMTADVNPIAAIAPLWIYLADTGVTLLRRFQRGENVLEAHREHTYQRLTDGTAGPLGSVAIVSLSSLVVVLLGLMALDNTTSVQAAVVAAMVVVTALYLWSPKLLATPVPAPVPTSADTPADPYGRIDRP